MGNLGTKLSEDSTMPLTTEEILKRVSEALVYAASVEGDINQLSEDSGVALELHSDAYVTLRVLTDLERDLTSDLLEAVPKPSTICIGKPDCPNLATRDVNTNYGNLGRICEPCFAELSIMLRGPH